MRTNYTPIYQSINMAATCRVPRALLSINWWWGVLVRQLICVIAVFLPFDRCICSLVMDASTITESRTVCRNTSRYRRLSFGKHLPARWLPLLISTWRYWRFEPPGWFEYCVQSYLVSLRRISQVAPNYVAGHCSSARLVLLSSNLTTLLRELGCRLG